MKKLTLISGILLAIAITINAQAPLSLKYQAIARDTQGNVISNANIGLRISILIESASGGIVYAETHKVRSNQFGLINLQIGKGESISGKMSDISWGMNEHFVKIEMDAEGGDEYMVMGVSQLLSVPYALYAKESGSLSASASKEAGTWTDGPNEAWLTNPLFNVGIGTQMPAAKFHVIGTGTNAIFERSLNNIGGPTNRFYKSRGSTASKQAVEIGDYLGSFQYWGYTADGTFNYGAVLGSRIENVGASDVAGNFVFMTTDNSFNYAERMRIAADGNVGIGTTNPGEKLHIAGNIKASGAIQSGNSIVIDGTNDKITATGGAIDFDDENLATTGTVEMGGFKLTATPSADHILVSNAVGTGIWTDPTAIGLAKEIDDLSDGKTGTYCVFLGADAGTNNTGTCNTAVGNQALYSNTYGSYNTATGDSALYSNTSGYYNTANGHRALYLNTNGICNTAIGDKALYSNITGFMNNAIGKQALYSNINGHSNTANGYMALYSSITGIGNTANGLQALYKNTEGYGNTAIGVQALKDNKSGDWNVAIGYQAGYNETGSNKLYIENSQSSTPLIYGEFDNDIVRINGTLHIKDEYRFPIADGSAGRVLKTNGNGELSWSGDIGATHINDLLDARTPGSCVYLGTGCGANDAFQNSSTGVGYLSLYSNTDGYSNTAVGYRSLYTNSSGWYNTAVGFETLFENTSGSLNTAMGYDALKNNTTGNNNTANGLSALSVNTTGSNNTAIGGYAFQSSGSAHYNSTAIGYQSGITASNQVVLGNSSITTLYCMGAYNGIVGTGPQALYVDNQGKIGTVHSSIVYKENITNMDNTDWIYDLRPVNYNYKNDNQKTIQYGLIAEEVERVNADFVRYEKDGSLRNVSYSQLISPMLKALQEQNDIIEDLKARIEELERKD